MKTIRFWNPAADYLKYKEEYDSVMQDVLSRGDLILRKDVEEFEEKLAKYVGTKYAVSVASGTDALILSLKAAGLQSGDKVLVPSYSFRATAEAVVHAGGVPVVYDFEAFQGFQEGIKYWIPAHIAGEVKTNEKAFELASKLGITVIEDACQAIGAAPVRGLTACYSFYPAKILGCYGDGGAIATNDEALYEKLKILRNHNKGDWHEVGYNSRLDNLQAAVLNVKIQRLPQYIARRKEIAEIYDEAFAPLPIRLPTKREVYQDYIIELSDKAECIAMYSFLASKGVETLHNGYPYPDIAPKGPKTLEYEARSLRLPCNPDMDPEEVSYVVDCIQEFYA